MSEQFVFTVPAYGVWKPSLRRRDACNSYKTFHPCSYSQRRSNQPVSPRTRTPVAYHSPPLHGKPATSLKLRGTTKINWAESWQNLFYSISALLLFAASNERIKHSFSCFRHLPSPCVILCCSPNRESVSTHRIGGNRELSRESSKGRST